MAHSSRIDKRYQVATYPDTGYYHLAAFHGILAGQANEDGTACFWFDGRPDTALIWPSGYTAHGEPLSVLDPQGRPVAVVGREFNGGGGLASQDRIAVSGCENLRVAYTVNPLPPIP